MPAKTQTSKKPYIVHHRHTFKRLPTHHTSYSLLVMLMMFVAIFSLGWTAFVSGDSSGTYQVQATIPAAPLTQGATITDPTDGQHVTTQMTTFSGYCPDHSYVVMQRDGVFAGSAVCGPSTSWAITVSLNNGINHMLIQDYNVTTQAGPATLGIAVYYDAPVDASTPDAPSATIPAANVEPLVVTGNYQFLGISVGSTLIETFTIHGGQSPYAISVDWGDGTNDLLSQSIAGDFSAKHVYTAPGTGEHSSYKIVITATDSAGSKTGLQTTAVVTVPSSGAATFGSGKNYFDTPSEQPAKQSAFDKFWRVAAPVYVTSSIALASFWLGQHRELELLRRR